MRLVSALVWTFLAAQAVAMTYQFPRRFADTDSWWADIDDEDEYDEWHVDMDAIPLASPSPSAGADGHPQGFTGPSGFRSRFITKLLRPRGKRSSFAMHERRRRASKGNYISPTPSGKEHVLVSSTIAPVVRTLARSVEATRDIELMTGIHRRNGSHLAAAAVASGELSAEEGYTFKAKCTAGSLARHKNPSDMRS